MRKEQISDRRGRYVAGLTKTQQKRFSDIDFKLYFLGELWRTNLVDHLSIELTAAADDISMYRDIAPENIELDDSGKFYQPTQAFTPLFEHNPQRVLTVLSQGFRQGVGHDAPSMLRCDMPSVLGLPKMSVLAPITRAIHRGMPVKLGYMSIESGHTERELVPFALVNIGIRWHVRAFDRNHGQFRDFSFTRMDSPIVLEDSAVQPHETAEFDVQWSRIMELELVPHPQHPRPEFVRMEYAFSEDGVLRVRVRAANAGYMLRLWAVDCSIDHQLSGLEYALWLRDPLALYGVSNPELAPGYKDFRSGREVKTLLHRLD